MYYGSGTAGRFASGQAADTAAYACALSSSTFLHEMTSWSSSYENLTLTVNRCVFNFNWRTIVLDFIRIRFETMEP